MTKIIFLDFDGPLLPIKADLPNHPDGTARMDPYAVIFINKLLNEDPSIQLVLSTSHAFSGLPHCKHLLAANGIDIGAIHKDWTTPRKMSSERFHEIAWWLDNHPEVTHYVAVDDLPMYPDIVPNATRVDNYNGFSHINYMECKYFLDLIPKKLTKQAYADHIALEKQRALFLHVRSDNRKTWMLREAADALFPRTIDNDNKDDEEA